MPAAIGISVGEHLMKDDAKGTRNSVIVNRYAAQRHVSPLPQRARNAKAPVTAVEDDATFVFRQACQMLF
ncbi:hypothetical protein ACMT1E_11100 [Sphingomonas flavalba]|uniref:hypothetical protein n=1 Tax=Sphingomonas flavalba TaxID=2559804 RepID=UPI0039DF3906